MGKINIQQVVNSYIFGTWVTNVIDSVAAIIKTNSNYIMLERFDVIQQAGWWEFFIGKRLTYGTRLNYWLSKRIH